MLLSALQVLGGSPRKASAIVRREVALELEVRRKRSLEKIDWDVSWRVERVLFFA